MLCMLSRNFHWLMSLQDNCCNSPRYYMNPNTHPMRCALDCNYRNQHIRRIYQYHIRQKGTL